MMLHRFHLLLVDDHETIRFTFRLALESDDYQVDTASSVAEAWAKLEQRYYDLLILDLRLGMESGLTLLAGIRAHDIQTPVLVMTAHGTTEDAVEAMKLGAVDFLSKPLEPVQFRATVSEILQRHLPSRDKAPAAGDKTYEQQIVEARHALNCRDFAAARRYLTRALQLNSHSADAHYLYGSMLELSNHPEKAGRYYHRALQLYAEYSFARLPISPRSETRVAAAH